MRPFLASACIAIACSQPAAAASLRSFTIPVVAEIGGKPYSCKTEYHGLGTVPAVTRIGDFRVYISSVQLVRRDGKRVPLELEQDGKWQYRDVALLDFEDGTGACQNGTSETNHSIRGKAPEGRYAGLEFTIGVPFDLNHGDTTRAPAPLNMTSIAWAWQVGFRFIKMEFRSLPDPIPAPSADPFDPIRPVNWSLHLGSTECASASVTTPPSACANPNRIAVRLDGFDPARNTVVFDPAQALAASNLMTNTPRTSVGCMSFPGDKDCAPLFQRLGLPFDGAPAGSQLLVTGR